MAAAVFAGFSVFVSSAWADSSVLTAENVCAQPSLLKATCTAQILLNEKTGQPLSFSVQPQPLLQDGEAANKVKSVAPGSVQSAGFGVSASAPAASLGTPQFLQQAYDLSALSVTAGYGDTVAIVDVGVGYQDLESDLAQYRAAYSLPPCVSASGCLRIVDENGGSNYPTTADGNSPGWGFETALDVDAVSAICPNCHILVVEASSETVSSYEAAENTAYRLGANQISNSWLEFWSFNRSDFVFPGVATVAAAGDYGYLNDPYSTPYPASFSGVTAVGGTALTPASTATARGVEETAAAGDSSSCSNEPQPTWQANANGGCAGRAVADISADGQTSTGLFVYYSGDGALAGYTGGGTSLATAIVAAYYGLIGNGVGVGGAAWAYNSNALNDITAGNNDGYYGSCFGGLEAMCNAGIGYDGPTGVGSISGAVVPGAPGVANGTACDCIGDPGSYVTASSATSVTLSGGVYPNQLDTRYWWEYGTTSAYGHSTTPVDIGAGVNPVAVTNTITGLAPGVSYDYALFAENSAGTVSYGGASGSTFDLEAAPSTTAQPPPQAEIAAPTYNSATSVTLQGTVNPEGSLTTYYFTEGVADSNGDCTPSNLNYGSDFYPQPLPGSNGNESTPFPVSQTINDLDPGSTYCFGVAAFNAGGSATGVGVTAPAAVAPTVAFTNVPADSSATTSDVIGFITRGDINTTVCTLDDTPVDCGGGTIDLTGLGVGSHVLEVDVSGDGGSATVSSSFAVTPPAPTVEFGTVPPETSSSTDAAFTYIVSGDASTVVCTLDDVDVACDNESAAVSGLGFGSHVFEVVVSGPGGSASAEDTFVVTAPPAPTVAFSSVPAAETTATSETVAYTVSGDVSGVVCVLDGVNTACDDVGADITGLALGSHIFEVEVSGPGGSVSASTSWETMAPAVAPAVVLTSVPASSTAATSAVITYTVSGDVSDIVCTLDGVNTACDNVSADVSGLGLGAHIFEVVASGPGGSVSVSTTWETTLPPAPTVEFTSVPADASTAASVDVTYNVYGDVSTVTCILDGVNTACDEDHADITGLDVGSHTFEVEVSGPGGTNVVTDAFVVQAPAVVAPTLTPPAPTPAPTSPAPTPVTKTPTTPVTKTPATLSWSDLVLTGSCLSSRACAVAAKFSFALSGNAEFVITLTRKSNGKTVSTHLRVRESAGAGVYLLRTRGPGYVLAAGVYKITVQAFAGSQKTSVFRTQLRVR